jgi:phosphoribosylanthranilate isomerase
MSAEPTTGLIASIYNLSDARYFAAADATFVLFSFDPDSDGFLAPENAREIIEWLSGPQHMGKFSFQEPDEINRLIEGLDLGAILLPATYDMSKVRNFNTPIYITVPFDSQTVTTMGFWTEIAEAYILHIDTPWLELTDEQKSDLQRLGNSFSIYLDQDVPANELAQWLESTQAKGVLLNGGEEEKVGFKSFEDIDAILEVIRY